MSNFEAFRWAISSSINLLFLKCDLLPSILAIALRGLRALKVLMVLKMGILPNPIKLAAKLTIEEK